MDSWYDGKERGNGTIEIKYKIWLEKDGRVLFGHGREELLRAIDECNSLSAAAKKLNMSYRAAWGRLKASEERLGIELVDRSQGKSMHLTPVARELLNQFDELEKDTAHMLHKAYQKLSHIIDSPSGK